eukprot:2608013-Prymnesium_polylepis.1
MGRQTCQAGHLEVVQLLSAFGASRAPRTVHLGGSLTAEEAAGDVGRGPDIVAWLASSRDWSTPLHHLTIITAARARTLLRDGADLSAASRPDGPTPLSIAQRLRTTGAAADGSAAHLVLRASQP